MVIALTHMREPNDLKLATNVPSGLIDVVLGGHDHYYAHHFVNGVHVLRSGSDSKQLSYLEARRKESGQLGWDFDIVRRDAVRAIPEDKASLELVEKLTSSLKQKLEKPVGCTVVPLDGRFTTIRTKESNLGNFVCDLIRHYYNADCAIVAAGTIRGDQIYPPGILQLKDIMNCFPFEDPVVVLRLPGENILRALENGVSKVPALEGRFPQVSNIQFKYDPGLPSGSRVLWAKINNEPLNPTKNYTLATRSYMSQGHDGFTSLLVKSAGGDVEETVSEENGILITMIMRQYFTSLKVLGKWTRLSPDMTKNWQTINQRLHQGGKLQAPASNPQAPTTTAVDGYRIDSDTDDDLHVDRADATTPDIEHGARIQKEKHLARTAARKWMRLAGFDRENVGVVSESKNTSLTPDWTNGIAPRSVLLHVFLTFFRGVCVCVCCRFSKNLGSVPLLISRSACPG